MFRQLESETIAATQKTLHWLTSSFIIDGQVTLSYLIPHLSVKPWLICCFFLPQETQNVDSNPTAASDQSQCDLHKPPEKLLCAQCRRILKTTPEVVQKKVCWICRF